MKVYDILGAVVAVGVIAGFVLHWPIWLDITLFVLCSVELVLLFKSRG